MGAFGGLSFPNLGGIGTVPTFPPVDTSNTGSIINNVESIGTSVLGGVLSYKIAQNQVNHGQNPSVGAAAGSLSSSTWILVGIAMLVLFVLIAKW